METRGYLCRNCGKKIAKDANAFWPFCSSRCKLLDLGNWASASYKIAGDPVDDVFDVRDSNSAEDADEAI
ncbi:MAG TPA: DNA gyrase inhibitor YacG [bacterium]|jgi:hypothetical protein|nr:DNA gyrase inhibitor YacG [Myxococcales bacterium]OQA58718.1 MAG: DNA gyrase inhibitor YacG [bacterium ADurb.Bin270]HPW44997.1 DNA gyrase inhibitor YacG [bacterium]HQG13792.1 DNA gyrase inhibitor YacG [bacterium]